MIASITEILHEFLGADLKAAGIVILNLLLIESLLSVDNAAVLATMVMDLPKDQRAKALKYGIIGAYVFRGLSLVFAAYLVQIAWLKGLGGLYLLWLTIDYFRSRSSAGEEDDLLNKKDKKWFQRIVKRIGPFWSTVILVEIMDMAFSIDNVFAAVAFTKNIYLIIIGVFIGILAMRFVAQGFVKVMERFPFLESAAFVVIAVLGTKLLLSFCVGMGWADGLRDYVDSHESDLYTSLATVTIFFLPLLSSLLFNFPKRKEKISED
jgi:YkoY family integral membrane protein